MARVKEKPRGWDGVFPIEKGLVTLEAACSYYRESIGVVSSSCLDGTDLRAFNQGEHITIRGTVSRRYRLKGC
jgi:hypothetical protein